MGQAAGSGTVVPPRVPRGCVPAAWKGQAGAPQVPRPEQRGSCPWDTRASPKRTEDPRESPQRELWRSRSIPRSTPVLCTPGCPPTPRERGAPSRLSSPARALSTPGLSILPRALAPGSPLCPWSGSKCRGGSSALARGRQMDLKGPLTFLPCCL